MKKEKRKKKLFSLMFRKQPSVYIYILSYLNKIKYFHIFNKNLLIKIEQHFWSKLTFILKSKNCLYLKWDFCKNLSLEERCKQSFIFFFIIKLSIKGDLSKMLSLVDGYMLPTPLSTYCQHFVSRSVGTRLWVSPEKILKCLLKNALYLVIY